MTFLFFNLRPPRKYMKQIGAEKNIYQLAVTFLLVNISDKK